MPVMDGLEMGYEIKKCFDQNLMVFIKRKIASIESTRKQYLSILAKYNDLLSETEL